MDNQIEQFNKMFVPLKSYKCKIMKCRVEVKSAMELLKHFERIHRGSKHFTSQCLYSDNCSTRNSFKSYDALYKHLKKFHSDFFMNTSWTDSVQDNNSDPNSPLPLLPQSISLKITTLTVQQETILLLYLFRMP